MKKILFILTFIACHFSIFGQSISFPTPELRVDTIKPLQSDVVTFMRPTTMSNKLLIKGNRIPPTFYFQIVDSLQYNRFGVTKNGMVISGTHHDPQVNLDGLFMYGRGNALKGADAAVAGKGVFNLADTTMAFGYYYTVPSNKNNNVIIGYGDNRIEMDADSGRFVGNWKLGTGSGSGGGGITTNAVTLSANQTITGIKKFIDYSLWESSYGEGSIAIDARNPTIGLFTDAKQFLFDLSDSNASISSTNSLTISAPSVYIADGNLGIGTNTPEAEFTVNSTRYTGAEPHFLINAGKNAGQGSSVVFKRAGAGMQNLFAFQTGVSTTDGFIGTMINKMGGIVVLAGQGNDPEGAISIHKDRGFEVGNKATIGNNTAPFRITPTGAMYLNNQIGTNGQALTSTGSGVEWRSIAGTPTIEWTIGGQAVGYNGATDVGLYNRYGYRYPVNQDGQWLFKVVETMVSLDDPYDHYINEYNMLMVIRSNIVYSSKQQVVEYSSVAQNLRPSITVNIIEGTPATNRGGDALFDFSVVRQKSDTARIWRVTLSILPLHTL